MLKIEAFYDSHFMHQTVRACHTDNPDSIVSSMACIVNLKIIFYITGKSHCYIIVKIEAFDDSHFMHQTVRGCHTDHPDSIVSSMACIFDFKIIFYVTIIKLLIMNRNVCSSSFTGTVHSNKGMIV